MLFTHAHLPNFRFRFLNSTVDPDLIFFMTEDQIVRFEVGTEINIKIRYS